MRVVMDLVDVPFGMSKAGAACRTCEHRWRRSLCRMRLELLHQMSCLSCPPPQLLPERLSAEMASASRGSAV